MALNLMKFTHKPLYVDAVYVTLDNMVEVADWCEGRVFNNTAGGTPVPYIKVAVSRPLRSRQTMAFEGDWVLRTGVGFKVYTAKAFLNSFVKVQETTIDRNEVKLSIDSELPTLSVSEAYDLESDHVVVAFLEAVFPIQEK